MYCIAAATLMLILQGCGTSFSGTTTYFYTSGPIDKTASVAVVPRPNQDSSLEWSIYRDQIALQLQEVGFAIESEQTADYLVVIDYAIDGTGETTNHAVPRYFEGKVVGVTNTSRTVHQRNLMVNFYGRGANVSSGPKPIVQIRVLSAGSSNELARVMPVLTKQAFYRWPGEPGKAYDWSTSD